MSVTPIDVIDMTEVLAGKFGHLLIDKVSAVSARRLMYCYFQIGANSLKPMEESPRLLTGR